ncbi:MAG: UDP-N-acetylglucosamine 1-carboxyvinyltransferase [Elusimicrobiota bacterium]
MDKFVIEGGRPLRGAVTVNGAKNAALPILVATLLTDEPCEIDNVPRLRDIRTTIRLLEILGKRVTVRGKRLRVEAGRRLKTQAPYEIVKQMRASVLVAGPLLTRFGKVRTPLPGGCAIGLRPIDLHVKGLEAMGAAVRTEEGNVVFSAGELRPARVRLTFPSVGATENIMMAAAGVPGATVIENAAREPEIGDLAAFLGKMGARISGAGSSRIAVHGAAILGGASHRVMSDRIETGTLLLACAAAGGDVLLKGADPSHLKALIAALRKSGARVASGPSGLRVVSARRPRAVSIRTGPHPAFPTDLQAPWMAYMTRCRGRCRIHEAVFERRFLHAAELCRMGARISVHGDTAVVAGVPSIEAAEIMASDIRGGAALVVAGLAARGATEVQRVYHIDRGYERLERTLRRLGARVRRAKA